MTPKRKNQCANTGLSKIVQQDNLNAKQSNLSLEINQYKIDELVGCLPPRAFQAIRFVKFVAQNPDSKTGECNVAVAGVNLSDIARKYNPYLRSAGYQLKCKLPCPLIKNRFGEETMQHLWRLEEVIKGVSV